MREERTRELWTWVAASLAYSATAINDFVLPLGSHFGRRLLGTALFAPDPILNVGILEWGYRSLWSPVRHLFEWNAGFPLHDSLAVTENLIGWQLLYTPLRAFIGPVAAYNAAIAVSFVLSALGAALLTRRLGAERYGAVVAGFIFAFVPFHLNHVIHIQTMAVFYCPFVIYLLDRFLSRPNFPRAAALAIIYVLSALSSLYFGLFLLLLIPAYVLLCAALGRYPFGLSTAGWLATAGLASGLILLPVLLPYLRFGAEQGYRHTTGTVIRFSSEVLSVFKTPDWVALWSHGPIPQRGGWTPAFPGVVASLLALFYLTRRSAAAQDRRIKILLCAIGFAAFTLALGPVLKIHAYVPIWWTRNLPLPGRLFNLLSAVRWPMRVLFFCFLFGSVLAGLGFSRLTERLTPTRRLAAATLALAALFLEYRPQPSYAAESVDLPPPLEMSDAYPFLAREADLGAVVEVPDFDADGDHVPYRARYVYASAGHLRRVVACHGTVLPSLLENLLAAAQLLPSEQARQFLTAWGVTRLVVHRAAPFIDLTPKRRDGLVAAGYRILYEGRDAVVFSLDARRRRAEALRLDPQPGASVSGRHTSRDRIDSQRRGGSGYPLPGSVRSLHSLCPGDPVANDLAVVTAHGPRGLRRHTRGVDRLGERDRVDSDERPVPEKRANPDERLGADVGHGCAADLSIGSERDAQSERAVLRSDPQENGASDEPPTVVPSDENLRLFAGRRPAGLFLYGGDRRGPERLLEELRRARKRFFDEVTPPNERDIGRDVGLHRQCEPENEN
jgi:hypothetical protein